MRKTLTLLLTAALCVASAQGTSSSQDAPAQGADARLSTSSVTLEMGRYGGPLSSMLAAVAKSAGYEIVFDGNVDTLAPAQGTKDGGTSANAKPVVYSFASKPFNEVWPLLMDVYGLSYEVVKVGGQDVLRLSTTPIQKIIKLSHSSAADTEQRVKLFFGTPQYQSVTKKVDGQDVQERVLADVQLDSPTMRVIADTNANALIVRGTNREIAQVEKLVADIEQASANTVAAKPDPAAQRIYRVQGSGEDMTALLAAQYPGLKVTPIGKTGQLVVTGQSSVLDAAFALLAQVDKPAPQVAPAVSARVVYAAKTDAKALSDLLTAQYPGVRVTTVGTTGQLVLQGPQDDIAGVQALLAQVDVPAPPAPSGPAIVQRTFTLSNAQATEVKATLEGTLKTDLTPTSVPPTTNVQIGTTVATPNAAQDGAALAPATAPTVPTPSATGNAATIIADGRTNSIIVRGTQRQVDQIAELIPVLDKRVPQINVQVRIQEVTETAARNLGIDWTAGFGNFVTKIVGGAMSTIFDATKSMLGFNLGATLSALESQGLTKRVYDGSVTLQSGQRASGQSGQTENGTTGAAASVRSGGRLELNLPGTGGSQPIQKQIDYGVILNFANPQVTADGTISLNVRSVVSDINSPADTALNPNLINLINREAQTTLSFKSGQTVLLSGLLSTNEKNQTTGVPFLSSLPLIGNLFKKDVRSTEQSQLLIVITGNIVE